MKELIDKYESVSASETNITLVGGTWICINPGLGERLIWRLEDHIPSIFTGINRYKEDFTS